MKGPYLPPFFFRSLRPGRVLRTCPSMRRTTPRRLAFDFAAFTGAATIAIGAAQMIRSKRVRCFQHRPPSPSAHPLSAHPSPISAVSALQLHSRAPSTETGFFNKFLATSSGPIGYPSALSCSRAALIYSVFQRMIVDDQSQRSKLIVLTRGTTGEVLLACRGKPHARACVGLSLGSRCVSVRRRPKDRNHIG
jgi:hypothetical protein